MEPSAVPSAASKGLAYFVRIGLLAALVMILARATDRDWRWLAWIGILSALSGFLFFPRPHCPRCGRLRPLISEPSTLADLWRNRWRCPGCHAHVGRKGQLLPPGSR